MISQDVIYTLDERPGSFTHPTTATSSFNMGVNNVFKSILDLEALQRLGSHPSISMDSFIYLFFSVNQSSSASEVKEIRLFFLLFSG